MRSKWLTRLAAAVGGLFGATIVLLSFLPGGSRGKSYLKLPKDLIQFKQSGSGISLGDCYKFFQARSAQIGGDGFRAREIYNELLETYPDNPIIDHNLGLIEGRNG